MSTDLTVTKTALDRLNRTIEKDSLDDLVKARTRRSLLLLDCSSSMSWRLTSGERRIDALRKVHADLVTTHKVPTAAFGPWQYDTRLIDDIPEPSGGTPLREAIEFGRVQGANHLVVITDGEPSWPDECFANAVRFGGPIDVFYIGEETSPGAVFCHELARLTGGKCGVTDLAGDAKRKALTGKIMLCLGDGKDIL
jgi:Mg-chelatase subunit ChlD